MSPATFRQRVGARIQRARWMQGWTQADAAYEVGMTFRYFAEIERGRRNPTLDVLFRIAKKLQVRVADLVDVDPSPRIDLDAVKLSPPKTGRKPTREPRRR